jgi:1-acyl-sn-glycerol-3-phosphate acyltransferase
MRRTIFDTPVINTLMCWISRVILGALGWRIEGKPPAARKYVLIAAPHTSNWDFPLTLMVCFSLKIKVYWMGKASLFPPVLGAIMRWLGGIPVDRSRQGNLVQSTVNAFNQSAELIIIVPPEGTRAKVTQWKTGFYYIAQGAGVPIALGFMDYAKKLAGIETLFHPSGDIEIDLPKIQAFYNGINGKNPKQF